MIVRLGNWSNNPVVSELCESLLEIEGTSRKATPQRCIIKRKSETLASVGLEKTVPVIEFLPGKGDYAEAHGSSFVKPHPMQQMAREGWLQARPENDSEVSSIISWVKKSLSKSES